MPHYKIKIEYDGTGLSGWQRQENGPSVQQHIEDSIFKMTGEEQIIQGSGRTDAGVHAYGQVANFYLERNWEPRKLIKGLNYHLRNTKIAILEAEEVDKNFNARFDAKQRTYMYRIINRTAPLKLARERAWHIYPTNSCQRLDIKTMHEAAQILVGKHDFSSFRASLCQAKSPLKTIDNIEVKLVKTETYEEIQIWISARSFLHNMVRNIVGTLVMVGKGKWNKADVKAALDAKDRTKAGATAPAYALYFMDVEY